MIFPNFDVPVSSPPHSQYDQKQEYAPGWGLRMKFKTFSMNDEEKHGHTFVICPSNYWPLGV